VRETDKVSVILDMKLYVVLIINRYLTDPEQTSISIIQEILEMIMTIMSMVVFNSYFFSRRRIVL
jgi:hypothetical protein